MRCAPASPPPLAHRLRPAVLLCAEVIACLTLWRLGRVEGLGVEGRHLHEWLRTAGTEDLIGASARMLALVLVAWLLVTTLASISLRTIPALRGASWLDALTLPAVRRVLDRALVLSFGVSSVVGQSAAGATTHLSGDAGAQRGSGATVTTSPDGRAYFTVTPEGNFEVRTDDTRGEGDPEVEVLVVRSPGGPSTSNHPPYPPPDNTTPDNTTRRTSPARAGAGRYTVRAGDSLWRIAESNVAAVAPDASEGDVSLYWTRLVEANRATLRSGDPSLIFPGEIVALPALDPSPS